MDVLCTNNDQILKISCSDCITIISDNLLYLKNKKVAYCMGGIHRYEKAKLSQAFR